MQPVQQKREKFLRIMLRKSVELWSVFADGPLKKKQNKLSIKKITPLKRGTKLGFCFALKLVSGQCSWLKSYPKSVSTDVAQL